MADNPNIPSNSESLPPNNDAAVSRAANSELDSTNPAKQGAGARPKTEEEAEEFNKQAKSSGDSLMDKAQGVVESATNKLGSGGPAQPNN